MNCEIGEDLGINVGLDRALWHMTVADQTLAAVVRGEMGMGGQSLGNLGLDGMGGKLARAVA